MKLINMELICKNSKIFLFYYIITHIKTKMMLLKNKNLNLLVILVLSIAAINWGSVSYLDTDLVKIVSPNVDVEKIIKGVVGVTGLFSLFMILSSFSM